MTPDPEQHPAARLLRRHAERRRAAQAAPPELHPATRGMLQAEVRRVYARPDSKPARHRPGWLRWAFAGPAFAVLLAGFFLAQHVRESSRPQSLASARPDLEREANAPASMPATVPPPAAAPAPALAMADALTAIEPDNEARKSVDAPATELARGSTLVAGGIQNAFPLERSRRGEEREPVSSSGPSDADAPALASSPAAPVTVAPDPIGAFASSTALGAAPERADARDEQGRTAPMSAAKPTGAAEPAALAAAGQAPAEQQQSLFFSDRYRAGGSAAGATAGSPALGGKRAEESATPGARPQSAEPQSQQQQFTFNSARFRQLAARRAARAAEPRLLNRFVLTRTADEIVIRDEDGTVYRGRVAQATDAKRRESSQTAADGVSFRVTGRNVRLQREIVIEGNLLDPAPESQSADRLRKAAATAIVRATVQIGTDKPYSVEAQADPP